MRSFLVLAAAAVAACGTRQRSLPAPIPRIESPAAVGGFAQQHMDIRIGTGAPMQPRKCVYAHYTGWLTNGTQFDSSRDTMPDGRPRTPIAFAQGARRVIVGWDVGFEGMRIGGQRRLVIPYQLAYGENGRPPVIPPRSELIFDVELMALADTLPRAVAAPGQPPQCPPWDSVSRR